MITTNSINAPSPFVISGGTYVAPSGGVEKVSYSSLNTDLSSLLSVSQDSGYLSCSLPISLYIASPGVSSIKIGFGLSFKTGAVIPNFSGTEGVDFVTLKVAGSGLPFSLCGTNLCLPLLPLTDVQIGALKSLDIVVQNASAAIISSFSSTASVSVLFSLNYIPVPTPPPSSGANICGYIDCTSTGTASDVLFTNVKSAGYDGAIIFGFGYVGPTFDNLSAICTDAYIPGDAAFNYTTKGKIVEKVADAKLNGYDKLLLSFGGASNIFVTGPESGSITTEAQIQTLAENMVAITQEVGCNGIDFDFEMDPSAGGYMPSVGPYSFGVGGISATQNFVNLLAQKIKTVGTAGGNNFYVASAPQVNKSADETKSIFVSNDRYQIFDTALNSGSFDYVFIQYYNTPPEANITYAQTSWSDLISVLNSGDTNTRFIVGYPSTAGAAVGWPGPTPPNYNNIFCYNSATPDDGITPVTNQLTTEQAVTSLTTILQEMQADSVTYPNFGGVFCWSLNRDFSIYYYDPPSGPPQEPYQPWTTGGTWGATMKSILDS